MSSNLFGGRLHASTPEEFASIWGSLTKRVHPYVSYLPCNIDLSMIWKALQGQKVSLSDEARAELSAIKVQETFLLPEDVKALGRLKQRFRTLPAKYEIEHESRLIPAFSWDELLEEAKPIQDAFEEKIMEIYQNWDVRKANFTRNMDEILRSIGISEEESSSIVNAVLSQESVKEREYFLRFHGMEMRAFDEDAERIAVKCLTTCIQDGFDTIKSALRTYKEIGTIKGTSFSRLASYADSMEKANGEVFGNEGIALMVDWIRESLSDMDMRRRAGCLEEAFFTCVEYADMTGLELSLKNSPYTEKEIRMQLLLRAA